VLRRVTQSARSVSASLESAHGVRVWTGEFLVCAIPASTLRDVVFTPALRPTQERAIAQLKYGPATRVLLQFERPFWRRRGRRRAFGTNQAYGAVWDGNEEQAGRAGILSCLAGGHASAETQDLVDREGVDGLVRRMRWLGRPSALRWAWTHRWEDDRWARGGYAYFDPSFNPADRQALSHQAGRVCFAGEHTSFEWQGYMSGAIESGRRAAAEVAFMYAPIA
jgi:monoamine oxidase